MKCSEELKEQAFHRVIRLVNLLMAAGAEGMSLAAGTEGGHQPEIARDDLITLSEYGRVPLFCSSDDVDDDFDSSRPDAPAAPPDQEVWTLASRDFAFPVTSLTHQESAMLLHILESLQECRTLAAMLRRSLKRPMERRRVAITGRTMYGEGQSEERIAQLEEYLAHRTCLHIVYQSARGQRVSRHICPVTLVYDGGRARVPTATPFPGDEALQGVADDPRPSRPRRSSPLTTPRLRARAHLLGRGVEPTRWRWW